MDMQTTDIPVNTRIVGDAKNISEGIYVLYLEDYVHTFIKKLIYEQKPDTIGGNSVNLYGKSLEQSSQSIMVISGASASEQMNKNYFSTGAPLCTAVVCLNKDKGIRFEISIKGTKVILDDFYIYYDQNEEMQNYLIAWNNERHEQQLRKTTARTGNRISTDNAAKIGRLTQAYHRESAKVSLVWGAVNVLSLSLVVCVIAYGIISLNSYGKMKSMQESIDYCMTFVSENIEKDVGNETQKNVEETFERYIGTVPTMNQTQEQDTEEYTEISIDTPIGGIAEELPGTPVTESSVSQETLQETANVQPAPVVNPTIPQYYVVQRGDTLRSICINTYGDYSKMDEICELNGLDNPDSILYGQKLLLP